MSALLVKIKRLGKEEYALKSEEHVCFERSSGRKGPSIPERGVFGIVNWAEGNLNINQIVKSLECGQVVDGSYVIVCRDAYNIRIWSDPLGTIPVYYNVNGNAITIGTNLLEVARSLEDLVLDKTKCLVYALFDYVPQPYTIFNGLYRIEPGTFTDIDILSGQVKTKCYFNLFKEIVDKATSLKDEKGFYAALINEAWLTSVKKVLESARHHSCVGFPYLAVWILGICFLLPKLLDIIVLLTPILVTSIVVICL
jgi:hypothetical protein